MGTIIESVDTLVADWLNVDVDIIIPCASCISAGLEPHLFKLDQVETIIARGKSEVLSYHKIITDLLHLRFSVPSAKKIFVSIWLLLI